MVGGVGDLNLDGYDDLLISAPDELRDGWGMVGVVYAFLGPISGFVSSGEANSTYRGADAAIGYDIAGPTTDLTGDGYPEVILGSAVWYETLIHEGSTSGELLSSDEAVLHTPGVPIKGFGDTNGDGQQELWTTYQTYYWEQSVTHMGTGIWGWYSVVGESTLLDSTADVWIKDTNNASFGISADSSQDYNSDGYDDLLVGAENDSTGAAHAGAVYVFLGPVEGAVDSSAADLKVFHEGEGSDFGWEVQWLGDENGDGTSEIAAASMYDDSACSDCGAVYLIPGGLSGTLALSVAYSGRLDGTPYDPSEPYGGVKSLSVGNLDGDGLPDLVVGGGLALSPTGLTTGTVYTFFGSSLTAF